MEFTTIKRKNPQNKKEKELFYPTPIYSNEIDLDFITDEISRSSSLTRGDVKSTLDHFLDILPKYLKLGMKIKLDGFGRMKIVFGGSGEQEAKDVTAENIRNIRIGFIADSKMKTAIEDIKFKKVDAVAEVEEETTEQAQ